MEQINRIRIRRTSLHPEPVLAIGQYLSDELKQVYPCLLPSPPVSVADADDADHGLPGIFDLSQEEFEHLVLLDEPAANPPGPYQQPLDQYPYERFGSTVPESELVNPHLPSSPSESAADVNNPLAADADHLPGLFDISQEESEHQVPLPVATPSGSIAPESEQVNPHVHLPSSPSGPAADAIGPLPVNAGHIGDLPPEMPCDKKCNGDLVGPHQCHRPKRGLRIICLTSDCMKECVNKNDFNRHCKTVHGLKQSLIYCTVAGCKRGGKGFSRQDNLTQHLRIVHKEEILKKSFRVQGSNWGFEEV